MTSETELFGFVDPLKRRGRDMAGPALPGLVRSVGIRLQKLPAGLGDRMRIVADGAFLPLVGIGQQIVLEDR